MFGPKHTLKSVLQELESGLRDGSIVLNPVAAIKAEGATRSGFVSFDLVAAASSAQGPFESFVSEPFPGGHSRRQKREGRATIRSARIMVATDGPGEEVLGHAFVQ
jgi:hypothetical protein